MQNIAGGDAREIGVLITEQKDLEITANVVYIDQVILTSDFAGFFFASNVELRILIFNFEIAKMLINNEFDAMSAQAFVRLETDRESLLITDEIGPLSIAILHDGLIDEPIIINYQVREYTQNEYGQIQYFAIGGFIRTIGFLPLIFYLLAVFYGWVKGMIRRNS